MADGRHLENRKTAISPKLYGRIWRNFALWHTFGIRTLTVVQKNWNKGVLENYFG